MKKKRFISFVLALALLLPSLSFFAPVKANEEKVIRVGFPQFSNLSETDAQGNHSGYLYEYLQEIAKYTGWRLEFVTSGSDNEGILNLNQMLADGEIDLMGGIVQNESTLTLYDFPEYDSGMSYTTLQVLQDNSDYDLLDYQSFSGMRVGVPKSAATMQKGLADFCALNDIELELSYFDGDEDLTFALESGQVDAILYKDLGIMPGRRIVAKFAGTPFYFAVTKGRSDLVRELNRAIERILSINPYFATQLYAKYFTGKSSHIFFSEEEKAYLSSSPQLNVALLENDKPFSSMTNGEWSGISYSVLEYIAENTGLTFQYQSVHDKKEGMELLESGQVDLYASSKLHGDVLEMDTLTFTSAYLTTQNILVKNKKVTDTDLTGYRLALVEGVNVDDPQFNSNHVYYPDLQACIDAVNSGKADYTYSNSYSIEQLIRKPAYQNLLLIPMNDSSVQFSMALASPVNANLLSILNKAIASLTSSTLQSIIFDNTAQSGNDISLSDYIRSHPTQSIIAVVILALAAIFIIAMLSFIRIRHTQEIALKEERYRILESIAGEYVFDYDYTKDCMVYSERYVEDFGRRKVTKNYLENHDPNSQWFIDEVVNKLGQEDAKEENGKQSIDFKREMADGTWTWMRVVYTVQYRNGKPIRIIGKLFDVNDEKRERETLLDRSQKDQMTGLYNHAYCEQRIAKYLENQRESAYGAFLLIDIDHFKDINDRLGHRAGDEVLKKLSSLMLALFRSEDVLARWGGDEFVVFMQDIRDAKVAEERARSLCSQMSRIYHYKGAAVFLSLSIGIALSRPGDTLSELYERADKALYHVKQNGRNHFYLENEPEQSEENKL